MLERALAAHLPFAWVTGDSVYGADSALRRSIEAASKGYVLTVTSAQHLGLRPVGDWATEVPKGGWTRLSAGDGAKGPRLYDWACVPFRGAREGWQKELLIRRALEKPDELTFYLTLAPEGTELATLVQVAGTRWTIEACFEAAKGEVGLDEYEVRSWTGWHRHVTLAHAGPCLSGRCASARHQGERTSTSRLTCCPLRFPRCAGSSGVSSGQGRPIPVASSLGRTGDADTSSAPDDHTGPAEPELINPGCSTRPGIGVFLQGGVMPCSVAVLLMSGKLTPCMASR